MGILTILFFSVKLNYIKKNPNNLADKFLPGNFLKAIYLF